MTPNEEILLQKQDTVLKSGYTCIKSEDAIADLQAARTTGDDVRVLCGSEIYASEVKDTESVGLWLTPNDIAEDGGIALPSPMPQVIGIHFEPFADGRGFSMAQTLRRRYKFTETLVATGTFLPDQAAFLFSCGFDELQFESATRARQAQSLLQPFSGSYQDKYTKPQ